MAATEFPKARCFSLVLALVLALPTSAMEAAEQKPSAAGTLVFVAASQSDRKPDRSAETPTELKQASSSVQHTKNTRAKASAPKPSSKKKPAKHSKNQQVATRGRATAGKAKAQVASEEAKQLAKVVSKADQIAQMLVKAHRLSQEAVDEKQFDEIALICSTAERLGATGDQLQFALQLNLWASNQRDSLRMSQLETQMNSDKSQQQRLSSERVEALRAELTKQKLRAQQAEQKLKTEELARLQRKERIAEQRESLRVTKKLRQEIAQLKQRAEQAEAALQEQRSEPLEPEPIDVFAESDIEIQQADAAATVVANAGESADQAIEASEGETPQVVEQALDWQALHDKAITLAEQGRYQQALAEFDRVIECNPMFAKAYSNRATLHAQQGDLEMAAMDYEQACSIDADFLHALIGLGRTYHQLGRLEEALECMNRCIALEAENAELYCGRADLYADLGNYRAALADYAQTIDLAPDFAHAYRNGAWLLATCPDPRYRDPKNAIRGALKAIEFNYGERHIALDTLAAALASDGQFEEAASKMQEALQLAPNQAVKDYRERLASYQVNELFFQVNTLEEEEVQTATYEVSDR